MIKSMKSVLAIGMCLLIIMLVYFDKDNVKQRGAEKEFYKKTESYEVIRGFLLKELEKNVSSEIRIEYNKRWYYIYYNPEIYNKSVSEVYEILNNNIKDNLDLLDKIEETTFDSCGVKFFNGYAVVRFVYDWERAFDRDYSIYWCEDYDILKLYLQDCTFPDTEYNLKKLGDDWYYVGWK